MKIRSPITLELVNRGLVKGSKEFKAAYQRMLRARNPEIKKREKENWRRYSQRKQLETDGSWQKERLRKWRESNPSKWQALMKRASEKGLHKRFYDRHKEKVKNEKRIASRKKRREDPTFGLWQRIRDCRKSGDFAGLKSVLMSKINELNRPSEFGSDNTAVS